MHALSKSLEPAVFQADEKLKEVTFSSRHRL